MNESGNQQRMGDPGVSVTTVESAANRTLVQPYEGRPIVELGEGTIGCPSCGSTAFRRSQPRFRDLKELLFLRYPLRCLRCSQRQYNDVAVAFLSLPPKSHIGRIAEGSDTWRNWTEHGASGGVPTTRRPMTTAVGTRAQRLRSTEKSAAKTTIPERIPSRRENDGIW